jgi:tetratricopeptide (TPR) repeat protein
MNETIACPHCRRRLLLPEEHLGRQVRCPSCQATFRAGADAIQAAPPAPPVLELHEPSEEVDREERPRPARRLRPARRFVEPARPRRSKGKLIAVVAVLVTVLGGTGLVALLFLGGGFSKANRVVQREDDEERRRELQEAFGEQPPLAEREIVEQLNPLFEQMGAALRARDAARLSGFFDPDRMLDELLAHDLLPPKFARGRREFVRTCGDQLGNALQRQAPLLAWNRFEIRHVKTLKGHEAVVIVRHTIDGVGPVKMRWWVTRRTGEWKIYDLEDLDTGMRWSSTVGSIAAAGVNAQQTRAVQAISEAMQLIVLQLDPDAAEKKLRQVAHIPLPGKLEALRWLVTATIAAQRGRAQDALDAINKAHNLHPDMPILDLLKGIAFNDQGQWDQALKHLTAYRDLLGDDAVICRELGDALRGVQRFDEARVNYRKALDLDPKDADAFLGLLQALAPGDKRDDLGTRFAKLDRPHENFDIFAEDCRVANDHETLEHLAAAMRKIDPQYGPLAYYQALAKAGTGKTDEAVPLFKSALAKEKNEAKRKDMSAAFLQAMVSAGSGVEAYAVIADAREAFRTIAAELKKAYRTDDISRLVAMHAKKHANDPLLPFYRGEVYVQDGRYGLADKAFTKGMANPPDRATVEQFRSSRVQARFHAGQALSAYDDIGPKVETFGQLASLCLQERDYPLLQTLLDRHAKDYPDSGEVLRYRFQLRIHQKRFDDGIAQFKAALAKQATDDKRRDIVSTFLYAMLNAGKALEGYHAAPDAQQAFEILANDLLDRGRRESLGPILEAHRGRSPNDPWLWYFTGEMHMDDEAWDKAVEAFRAGLSKAPQNLRDRFRSSYYSAMYRAGRALQAYRESEQRPQAFGQLANLLVLDKKAAELEALVAEHRPHAGADPDVWFFAAQAKALLNQPEAAAPLLKKAYDQQTLGHRRRYYVDQFALTMHDLGKDLEGYRTAPDPAAAFDTLARQLVFEKKADPLAQLLGEHGKRHADDRFQRFYCGELHLLRGDAQQAERDFAAALAKAARNDQWMFKNALNRARMRLGKTAAIYEELGSTARAFEDLAHLCISESSKRSWRRIARPTPTTTTCPPGTWKCAGSRRITAGHWRSWISIATACSRACATAGSFRASWYAPWSNSSARKTRFAKRSRSSTTNTATASCSSWPTPAPATSPRPSPPSENPNRATLSRTAIVTPTSARSCAATPFEPFATAIPSRRKSLTGYAKCVTASWMIARSRGNAEDSPSTSHPRRPRGSAPSFPAPCRRRADRPEGCVCRPCGWRPLAPRSAGSGCRSNWSLYPQARPAALQACWRGQRPGPWRWRRVVSAGPRAR